MSEPPLAEVDTTTMEGVVVPTGNAEAEAPAPAPAPRRLAEWNPKGLKVPSLPKQVELFGQQFVPEYLDVSPKYLTNDMRGDIGFDPWALTVLANPTMTPDALQALDGNSRTAKERNDRMLALSEEEQQEKLMWMLALSEEEQ